MAATAMEAAATSSPQPIFCSRVGRQPKAASAGNTTTSKKGTSTTMDTVSKVLKLADGMVSHGVSLWEMG